VAVREPEEDIRIVIVKYPRLTAFVIGVVLAGIVFVVGMPVIRTLVGPEETGVGEVCYEGTVTTADGTRHEFAVTEGEIGVPEPEPLPPEPIVKEPEEPPPRKETKARFYEHDPHLGFRQKPSVKVEVRKKHKGKVLYDVSYTTDRYSRRITVPKNDGDRALVFMGCSYTFGSGVNDDRTLPSQVAALMPDCQVVNYGQDGIGAQHICEILRAKSIHTQGIAKKAAVIYTFLHVHIRRAIGVEPITRAFGKNFPWYLLEDGKLVRKGRFSDRPGDWDWKLSYRRKHGIKNWYGEYIIEEDAALVCALLGEAKRLFEAQFDSQGFYLLVFPQRQGAYTERVMEGCRTRGFTILDYRDILGKMEREEDFFIPHDGHPLPSTYRMIAEKLRGDLTKK
jgi:hypothetical protein